MRLAALVLVFAAGCTAFGSASSSPADAGTPDRPTAASSGSVHDGGAIDGAGDGGLGGYMGVVVADAPIAYWRMVMDGGAIPNVVAGGPSLVVNAGIGSTTTGGAIAGDSDGALALGGDVSWKSRDSTAFVFDGSSVFTVEAWLKPETDVGLTYAVLGLATSNGNVIEGYELTFDPTNHLTYRFGNGVDDQEIVVDTVLTSEWHHVVVVQAATTAALYVDGTPTTLAGPSLVVPSTAFAIAAAPLTNAGYKGALDELAIYAHELSKERIALHYKVGTGN